MSHGSDHHRAPGSIGSAYPQRVVKGKKMPGQLGNVVSRCEAAVYDTIGKDNILLLKGSLPGAKGAWLKIQSK
jgi:large subunit ribosomal protein L3